MDIVFGYSDRIIALHQGKVLADATPAAIQADAPRGGHGHRPAARTPPDARGRAASTSTSRPATSCAASRSRSASARSSAWSAATARARPPRCARSWAISARAPGAIDLQGRSRSTAGRTHEIARRGIGWAPEDSGIFADLTVAENIEISTWTRPSGRARPPSAIERAYEVFPVLRALRARARARR